MAKRRDVTPVCEASTLQLLRTGVERAEEDFQRLATAKTMLGVIADCIDEQNWVGISRLKPKMLEIVRSD